MTTHDLAAMKLGWGLWVGAFAATVFSATAVAQHVERGELLPTEALHVFHERLGDDFDRQRSLADSLLAITRRAPSSRHERFALGELYFVSLRPDSAWQIFSELDRGDDYAARVATQRKLRMGMAAYDRYEAADSLIVDFYHRFAPDPGDYDYNYQAVATLARYHAARAQHDSVVGLVRRA